MDADDKPISLEDMCYLVDLKGGLGDAILDGYADGCKDPEWNRLVAEAKPILKQLDEIFRSVMGF